MLVSTRWRSQFESLVKANLSGSCLLDNVVFANNLVNSYDSQFPPTNASPDTHVMRPSAHIFWVSALADRSELQICSDHTTNQFLIVSGFQVRTIQGAI